MGQISVTILAVAGSNLSGNQQLSPHVDYLHPDYIRTLCGVKSKSRLREDQCNHIQVLRRKTAQDLSRFQ